MGLVSKYIKYGTYGLVLGGAIIVAVLALTTHQESKSVLIPITNEVVFDPLCVGSQNLKFDYSSECVYSNTVQSLGSSINIDDIQNGISNDHVKTLFLKMNISNIPTSDFFFQKVSITKANLIIKTEYQYNITKDNNDSQFFIINGFCQDSSWSNMTTSQQLPCIDSSKRSESKISTFSESFTPKFISQSVIDLKSHIDYAQENKQRIFTELIQFYPTHFLKNNNFDSKTDSCIRNSNNLSDSHRCINSDTIYVFGSEYSTEGAHPLLLLEYNIEPTILRQIVTTALIAAIPIVIPIIKGRYDEKDKQEKKMNDLCEAITEELEDTKNALTKDLYETFDEAYVDYEKDQPPLKFSIPKKVIRVYLATDVYKTMVGSGELLSFGSKTQIKIVSLYQAIEQYNEKLNYVDKIIDDTKMQLKDPKVDLEHVKWYLEKILLKYYTYLGNVRDDILRDIEEVQNIFKKDSKKA